MKSYQNTKTICWMINFCAYTLIILIQFYCTNRRCLMEKHLSPKIYFSGVWKEQFSQELHYKINLRQLSETFLTLQIETYLYNGLQWFVLNELACIVVNDANMSMSRRCRPVSLYIHKLVINIKLLKLEIYKTSFHWLIDKGQWAYSFYSKKSKSSTQVSWALDYILNINQLNIQFIINWSCLVDVDSWWMHWL